MRFVRCPRPKEKKKKKRKTKRKRKREIFVEVLGKITVTRLARTAPKKKRFV
jgi:hypothetical protein